MKNKAPLRLLPVFAARANRELTLLNVRSRSIDDSDRLDFDHEVGVRQTPHLDGRTGRQGRAEIAQTHVAVILKLVKAADVGVGLDNVGEAGAGGFEQVLMFSPTCWIWARMSLLPTQLPSGSRASCPATKIIFPMPLTVTTCV
jgi:hypothetical protein